MPNQDKKSPIKRMGTHAGSRLETKKPNPLDPSPRIPLASSNVKEALLNPISVKTKSYIKQRTIAFNMRKQLAAQERFINAVGGPREMYEFIERLHTEYKQGKSFYRIKRRDSKTVTGLKVQYTA